MMTASSDPWEVSEAAFPRAGTPAEQLTFLLNYAVLAPSGHNTQPWSFRLKGNTVELYADRSSALPIIDPHDRELILSCGAALLHLRIAIRHFGYSENVKTFPVPDNPDLLAHVQYRDRREADPDDSDLFHAITQRRTHRLSFQTRVVPDSLLSRLEHMAVKEGAWLHIIEQRDMRLMLADLIAEGDRRQWADERFRREVASWTHSDRTLRRDGIPGYAHGVANLAMYAGPLGIRTLDLGDDQAARDRELALKAPALVVLGTDADTPSAWLTAGQALARVLLRARVSSVWASFLSQPIQVPALRGEVSTLLGRAGFPQIVLRLGYGSDVRPTPRRSVQDVLAPGM